MILLLTLTLTFWPVMLLQISGSLQKSCSGNLEYPHHSQYWAILHLWNLNILDQCDKETEKNNITLVLRLNCKLGQKKACVGRGTHEIWGLLLLPLLWRRAFTHPENHTFTKIVFTSFTFPQLFLLCRVSCFPHQSPPNIWEIVQCFFWRINGWVQITRTATAEQLKNSEQHQTFWKYDIFLETNRSGSQREWVRERQFERAHCGG